METVLDRKRGRVGRHRGLALTGNLHFPELRAEIAFDAHDGNGNGNGRTDEYSATAAIIPPGFTMIIPLQVHALPARGECDVWALTPAPDRDPPWIERSAGELGSEPLWFDQYIPVDVTLDVSFTPQECHDGRGAMVDVAGELRFERPVHMRLLFRSPTQSTARPSDSDGDEVVLIAAGSRVPIPRQTVSTMATRNPHMTVRVIEADSRVVRVEHRHTGLVRSAA